mgnify:CR=1 FL=1
MTTGLVSCARLAGSFIWENFYDPEEDINEYDLTVFVEEEDGRFRRFTDPTGPSPLT